MEPVVSIVDTPLGRYALAACDAGLTHVQPLGPRELPTTGASPIGAAARHLERARRALCDYFAGERTDFGDLVTSTAGSPFQRRVWSALCRIPYGTTESYGEIARRIGAVGSARAVGTANRENPLGIVVPCHRVVGADGALVGYAGGLDRKAWLLAHEGAAPLIG